VGGIISGGVLHWILHNFFTVFGFYTSEAFTAKGFELVELPLSMPVPVWKYKYWGCEQKRYSPQIKGLGSGYCVKDLFIRWSRVEQNIFHLTFQRIYIVVFHQLCLLESISHSLVYSHFTETLQGAATIRAFKQQERFIRESELRVDENQTSYYPAFALHR